MLNKLLIAILVIVFVSSVGWMVSNKEVPDVVTKEIEQSKALVTMYKSSYCSCCSGWGLHMEGNGYEVETILEDNMEEVKERLNVPYDLQSCHTSEIDGYIVEGHIPSEAIDKLLEEKPDIKGIGMAGMPSGSPGMPGPKEDFMIYEINHNGTKGELFMQL